MSNLQKKRRKIQGLHGLSGEWVDLGWTETELDADQVKSLVSEMMRDTDCPILFEATAYDPTKFDAFRAEY